MFFPRLRRQAKWVFVLLALAFAVGFVFFGVGTGSGGLGDVFQGVGGGSSGSSLSDAREAVQKRPNNPKALRDLATALETDGQNDAAIEPLRRYTELRPKEADALRELASLYLRRADTIRTEAIAEQAEAGVAVDGSQFGPPADSRLGRALGSDPILDAVRERETARITAASTRLGAAYGNAVSAYRKLAEASPNDSTVQFELAQAAEAAGDAATAVVAYRAFVKLAPDDPTAPAVRQRIKQLETQSRTSQAGG